MKSVSTLAVAVVLTGCAAPNPIGGLEPLSLTSAGGPETSAGPQATSVDPNDLKVAKVVELRPETSSQPAPEEPVCRMEQTTGSRIAREVCRVPPSETEARMQNEMLQAELEHARDLAQINEAERARRISEQAIRRQHMIERARMRSR